MIAKDWLPYSKHSESRIPFFVMSSHTELIVDGKNLGVVTYSKDSLNHLRSITSKNQLVITDDLEMKGAKVKNKSFENAAYDSFMAGHDLLLIGWPGQKLKRTLKFFKTKLAKDPLFRKRLDVSLNRVYKMKHINKKLKTKRPLFNAKASLNFLEP